MTTASTVERALGRRRWRPGPRLLRAGAMATVVALLAVVLGAAASAQFDRSGLPAVTSVDARTAEVELSVLNDDYSLRADAVTVTEDDASVASRLTTVRAERRPTELVFVLDTDNRNSDDSTLDWIGQAMAAAVADLPPEIEIGVVTAGARAAVLTRLTANPDRVAEEIRAVTAERGAALFDAIDVAGQAMTETPGVVRTVVVFTGGRDTASTGSADAAAARLVQAGAQLVTIRAGSGEPGLEAIEASTGGATIDLPEPAAAVEVVRAATALAVDRLLVSYRSDAESGERRDVTLTVGGAELDLSYPAGVITTSGLQLAPTDGGAGSDLRFFGQRPVLYASVLLAFAAITLAVWALGSMYGGGQSTLESLLARYADNDETLEEEEVQEMLVQSALIQRAVDFTESFAESRGFLARVEDLLERANLPVRAGEAIFFLSAAAVVVTGLTFVVGGSIFFAALAGLLMAAGGFLLLQFLAARRLKVFESQLPDTLQLLAGTLRAGYSLPQGLDAVADEIADPMGYELRRAITEAQLGRELDEALTGIADRLDSPDFAWAVMAIGIQREVGGNLNELLMTVSETMVQRERLRREVNALTAEGRVSAAILSFLPPGLGFVLWVMNPEYVGILFSQTLGWIMLGLAIVSALIGLVWMKKVITIDA